MHRASFSPDTPGVLAPRVLFVDGQGWWYISSWCLVVSPCQTHSFFFLGLDSKPNVSDPWPRVTASSPVSWRWLYGVPLGSEIIPAGLYFCTEPCKGSLEQNFQGGPGLYLSWALRVGFPLTALELIVTSRRPGLCPVWFLCGQSEEVTFPPADRQSSALPGMKFEFDRSFSQC